MYNTNDYDVSSNSDISKKQSKLFMIWRQLKKNKIAMLALFIILIFILIAAFADVITPYSKAIEKNIGDRLMKPSKQYPFGTDEFGRDMFARVIHGARISTFIGFVVSIFATVLGCIFGCVAAYYGGVLEGVIMRFMDVVTSLPSTLLAMTVVAALGGGMKNLLIALTIAAVPSMTRIVRSSMLPITEKEYVEAAFVSGANDFRIMFKHVLPNGLGPIIVQSTRLISSTILNAAGLSYIGLGIQSPTPEWGSMLSGAREFMRGYPYLMVYPGIALILAALSYELLGDGLRDALDPRLKN